MAIPPQKKIQEPLLRLMVESGGTVHATEAYRRLAEHFGLTKEELAQRTNDNKEPKWNNQVRYAVMALKNAGEVYSTEAKVWAITEAGRARIGESAVATVPTGRQDASDGEGPAPVDAEQEEIPSYDEPSFDEIEAAIAEDGLRINARTLRRYHVALKTRGFVILCGVSGTGKTWLTEAYAEAVGAAYRLVPVAPNWTTNEDLLGYFNPLDRLYNDTPFSRFLREAATEYQSAKTDGRQPQPYHLVLDEMNLARVEYYFARFLSAMEARMRNPEKAKVELSPDEHVQLPPNLRFIGTVNMDETTHGFSDKVFDRAQLIELPISRVALDAHLAGEPYREAVLEVWDAVAPVAPFAFRVADEFRTYIRTAEDAGATLEEALDEQFLHKVLPKVKGADPKVGQALEKLAAISDDRFPLTHSKAVAMLGSFRLHGFADYFAV